MLKFWWKLFHRRPYYFVTSIRRYLPDPFEWTSMVNRWKMRGVWDDTKPSTREDWWLSDTRCWGFYKSKNLALKAVKENWTDLYECGYYKYAVVEEFHEGLLDICPKNKQTWFEWVDDGYKQIEPPDWATSVNYGIG